MATQPPNPATTASLYGLTHEEPPPPRPPRVRARSLVAGIAVVALLAVATASGGILLGGRAWGAPHAVLRALQVREAQMPLDWPVTGTAAVGAGGYGVLAATGTALVRPIASTAKLITALAVLQKAPLQPGAAGPTLTMTPADVAIYLRYNSEDGSLIPVSAGEQISEYDALQAMLIPSADNIADSLATWAYGSMPAYLAAANRLVLQAGMTETVVAGDASGFLPATVSTAQDLVLLGQAALANPVIAGIVAQKTYTLPAGGPFAGLVVENNDTLLGTDGIDGIKTGNTDQAGGVFVFAAPYQVGSHSLTIVGAVMGAPTLPVAFSEAAGLLGSAEANFTVATPVRAGQVVATYHVPWQGSVALVAEQTLSVAQWRGTTLTPAVTLHGIRAPAPARARVGEISVTTGGGHEATGVALRGPITRPPGWLSRVFARL